MADLVAMGAGLLAGLVASWLLLRRAALARAEDRFEAWRATEGAAERRRTAAASRAATKDGIGSEAGGWGGALAFAPADVRFLGDPVTFVVFDGHTDVKDRACPGLREVCFVGAGDETDHRLVAECVAGGRVEWATVRLP